MVGKLSLILLYTETTIQISDHNIFNKDKEYGTGKDTTMVANK